MLKICYNKSMIAMLTGKIIDKNLGSLILDVQGVGYEVLMPTSDADDLNLNQEIRIFTYHHIREQSQELFGFTEPAAKELFKLLITVQGVGPKAGLAILSLGKFETVRSAIAREDAKYIQQASGVGKKTAERIIVDLADKVGIPTEMSAEAVQTELNTNDEAVEALEALGFSTNEAIKALAEIDRTLPVEKRIKLALQNRK